MSPRSLPSSAAMNNSAAPEVPLVTSIVIGSSVMVSLGRAGVQKLVQLPENRGLWLTYAKYLTPKGDPIHGKGIEPDVRVEEPDVEFGGPQPEKDAMLDTALEHLRKKVA
jgi:carboxyl-terminal processing protease